MATKEKLKGFKRQSIDGKFRYVMTLSNGNTIHTSKEQAEFEAYDSVGRWLGFGSFDKMLRCASNGWHTCPHADGGKELDLWVLWNCHVDSGNRVLEDKESQTQFIFLADSETVLSAKEEPSSWRVRITNINELYAQFSDEDDTVLQLTIADNPFRLA